MTKDRAYSLVGWCGAVAILAAFAFVSFGMRRPEDALPLALNISGAIAVAASAWRKKSYPSAALNVVWVLIGIATLVRSRLSL